VHESALTIRNSRDVPIKNQEISVGLPLPAALCRSVRDLSLVTDIGSVHCHEITATALWPDGSIQWVLIVGAVSVPANAEMRCRLLLDASVNVSQNLNPGSDASTLQIVESESLIELTVSRTRYRFDHTHGFFPTVEHLDDIGQMLASGDLLAIDKMGDTCRFELEKQFVECGSRSEIVTVIRHGRLSLENNQREISVVAKYRLYANTGLMSCSITIHNPSRAIHQDGYWDLGDAGSILFRSLTVEINGTGLQKPTYSLAETEPVMSVDGMSVSIEQSSSGGLHRVSQAHVQANGSLPDLSRCCVVTGDNDTTVEIARASPILHYENDVASISFSLEHFWQNFPKAIHLGSNRFELALFPANKGSPHELQGGEKKTHQFFLSIDSGNDKEHALQWLRTPANIIIDSQAVYKSGVFPYAVSGYVDKEYDALLSLGIEGDQSFLAKRERVDEYGWRNFGELFADHETWLYGVTTDFHSHYNNQYDPLAGFARQYALSGDHRWFVLMRDLARHILDIDLYDTDQDRVEYNHGYFWHTNHHVSAYTCTHRTFSNLHQSDLDSHSSSGGPGDQHCYTTGFRLYYCLTGDVRARDALLSVTAWADKTINGSGGLIDGAIRFLRRGLGDGLRVMKGERVFRYQYPMDRGTGNFVRALINCYRLTGEKAYLTRAEAVIENTLSATDDIALRGFNDIEGSWFYTVMLQEVADYLQLKRQENSLDESFTRILHAYFHYVEWMLENELPFLEQEDKLEFVNNTWTAQDMRKANIFYIAYELASANRILYKNKAQYFREYVIKSLNDSDSPWYTRVQAILHQNQGPNTLMYVDTPIDPKLENLAAVSIPDCFYSRQSYIRIQLSDLLQRVRKFSLVGEINWLKSRSGKAVNARVDKQGLPRDSIS